MGSALAALAAAVAVWLGLGTGGRLDRLRPAGTPAASNPRVRTLLSGLAGLAAVASIGVAFGGLAAVLSLSALELGWCGWLLWSRHRAARRAGADRAAVARACRVMAAQTLQGRVAGEALASAARDVDVLAGVAWAAQLGDDVPAAFRRAARRPGCDGLAEVGRAWAVSERTGAPLAATLTAVAQALRRQLDVSRVASTELAATRATSQLLAVLPLIGLAMGFGLGGDPVAFLSGTTMGRWCWAAGVTLACVGVLWVDALASRAGRAAP